MSRPDSAMPNRVAVFGRSTIFRTILALSLCAEGVVLLAVTNPDHPARGPVILGYETAATGCFALALIALVHSAFSRRMAVTVVFGTAIVLNLIGMLCAPTSSDDDFRYAWDAKVQLAGIDPYRYTPADPELAHLREPFTFPTNRPCMRHQAPNDVCTQINRPTVHTIYPPVAQAAFVAMRVGSFGGRGGHFPLQIGAILASLGVAALLIRAGTSTWQAALWAWCPITVLELANNAHIEGVAVLLSVAAVIAAKKNNVKATGIWLGAAIATKLYPALLLPALMRRRPVVVIATSAAFVVLSYLPHVAAVGSAVVGYLPGYLHEGDYLSGGRFLLLGLLMPQSMTPYAAAALMLGVALWVWRTVDPKHPELASLHMGGAFFLIVTPNLSWYSLLLLALAALAARPEWFGVVAAPSLMYLGAKRSWDPMVVGPTAYALGAAIVIVVALIRARPDVRGLSRVHRAGG